MSLASPAADRAPPRAQDPAAGLSEARARARLAQVGPNELERAEGPHWARRFLRNLTYLFALLLWAGAALAWVGGLPQLSAAIVAVILVNALFSFAQEHRAERAVEALARVLPQRVRVRRDGRQAEVDAEEVVPGDVLLLAAGDRVPADGDLLSAVELKVDLSTLTGESRPVRRTARAGAHGRVGIEAPDRVLAGTFVVAGAGEAIATATGMRTELGQIARLTQRAARGLSPLERQMQGVTRLVAVLSISLGGAFFLLAGTLGMSLEDRFVFAIGVIVANVPEGLLPTVTLSLAMATQRMARRNAIVRRLSSVETLGSTTVICTDKTGTLTANEMTVRRVWLPGDVEAEVTGAGYEPAGRVRLQRSRGWPAGRRRSGQAPSGERPNDEGDSGRAALLALARSAALCNDATLTVGQDGAFTLVGDPTEGALLTLALKLGLAPVAEAHRWPRRAELPFDSARKRMTTIHVGPAGTLAHVKGAPGEVLTRCRLSDAERAAALRAERAMAGETLRVLAIARRADPPPASAGAEAVERDLELLGLVGMHDPPRPEVAGAIAACGSAGIRVVMVTGDHGVTAEAIARRVGLLTGPAQILDGPRVDALDDAALGRALSAPDVLVARVTPSAKQRIARVLRASGEVVAMTGDGVNDAPALRAADIGVAMGRSGTDVAREAADIVLADDDFASIAAAVEEGRAVYDNIRRFAQYHFSGNVAELLCFLAWGLSGGAIPLPLVVMQVLAIDLGTDLLPAIALGAERAEPGVMRRPPRRRSERLLSARVLARVYGFVGLLVGACGLASFFAAYLAAGWSPGEPLADTGSLYVQATAMTYAGIVAGQVGAAFAFRTARTSILDVGLLSNRLLLWGIASALAMLVAVISLPPLQEIFHTAALEPWAWGMLLAWPLLVLAAEEGRKAIFRRWVWG